jgi:hypothetical protein
VGAAGLLVDIDTLHLDRGYDYPVVGQRLAAVDGTNAAASLALHHLLAERAPLPYGS